MFIYYIRQKQRINNCIDKNRESAVYNNGYFIILLSTIPDIICTFLLFKATAAEYFFKFIEKFVNHCTLSSFLSPTIFTYKCARSAIWF